MDVAKTLVLVGFLSLLACGCSDAKHDAAPTGRVTSRVAEPAVGVTAPAATNARATSPATNSSVAVEIPATAEAVVNEPIERLDLRGHGVNGFPQKEATVLCDQQDLRLSVYNDDAYLYVQAILWNDDDDGVETTTDGRAIGDWSNLLLDVDADRGATPQVDRHYSLNPWASQPGLHYQVMITINGYTGLKPDSAGRGATEYFDDVGGKRSRVDSFLIPLEEIKKRPGEKIRLAYWRRSATPDFTVNSIGFEKQGKYYAYSLPHDLYHEIDLATGNKSLEPQLVPDTRRQQPQMPVEFVATPPLGAPPPEVAAASWLNTDSPQTLEKLRGQVVLIEFWATWCGPCIAGIPHLNELHKKYGPDGLRVLSFTDQEQSVVDVFQKAAKTPIEYPIGAGSDLAAKYGVQGIPHAFVVGRDGKLLWHGHPATTECEDKITAALAEK